MQALHVQQSSVPAPYNKRRIPVGMVGVTTGDATKSRLAFARACVHDTTCSTRLGTIGRVHFDHQTAALLHLVGEDQVERAPTLIFRMERLSPAFCRTMRPGSSTVPEAEAVMFWMRRSSSTAMPNRWAMSSAARWWKSRRMRPARP